MIKTANVVAEIGLLIYPDCQLAAIYGLTDLFRISGEWAQGDTESGSFSAIRVSHWQVENEGETVTCIWDSHPDEPHVLAHIIVPPSIVMPENMHIPHAAATWMKAQHAQGSTLCSVCAGAFILAETGLMDGRRVTTHWAFARQLAARYPEVNVAEDNMVIDDGDIITAGGILAWADLGLSLVQRFLGAEVMLSTVRFLLLDPPRQYQRPFAVFIPQFNHGDDVILRVQHYLHASAGEPQVISALAEKEGMSERTFLRRFTKATGLRPVEYLQQIRIMKAREALELTVQPVEQIAWQVGYKDPAAFRKIFHKLTGLTPGTYRQRFSVLAANLTGDMQ
ncbi:GlxA family transcriptional regulator [Mangrovibacter yixingensis]|uniref:GlxA family transcriptional regulator n=1 Tax=Mangrovibacter yixingensis TaxID=1529639 RepID=UPI001CFB8ACD|nr:GlxA family transcriptional regulator [Mangrovibacter yixingensis]